MLVFFSLDLKNYLLNELAPQKMDVTRKILTIKSMFFSYSCLIICFQIQLKNTNRKKRLVKRNCFIALPLTVGSLAKWRKSKRKSSIEELLLNSALNPPFCQTAVELNLRQPAKLNQESVIQIYLFSLKKLNQLNFES